MWRKQCYRYKMLLSVIGKDTRSTHYVKYLGHIQVKVLARHLTRLEKHSRNLVDVWDFAAFYQNLKQKGERCSNPCGKVSLRPKDTFFSIFSPGSPLGRQVLGMHKRILPPSEDGNIDHYLTHIFPHLNASCYESHHNPNEKG